MSGHLFFCIVRIVHCSPPMDVSDGGWTMVSDVPAVSGYYRVGSEVRYTCSKGYRLVGAETLRCNADQLWSRVPPTCVPQSGEHIFTLQVSGVEWLSWLGVCRVVSVFLSTKMLQYMRLLVGFASIGLYSSRPIKDNQ